MPWIVWFRSKMLPTCQAQRWCHGNEQGKRRSHRRSEAAVEASTPNRLRSDAPQRPTRPRPQVGGRRSAKCRCLRILPCSPPPPVKFFFPREVSYPYPRETISPSDVTPFPHPQCLFFSSQNVNRLVNTFHFNHLNTPISAFLFSVAISYVDFPMVHPNMLISQITVDVQMGFVMHFWQLHHVLCVFFVSIRPVSRHEFLSAMYHGVQSKK